VQRASNVAPGIDGVPVAEAGVFTVFVGEVAFKERSRLSVFVKREFSSCAPPNKPLKLTVGRSRPPAA